MTDTGDESYEERWLSRAGEADDPGARTWLLYLAAAAIAGSLTLAFLSGFAIHIIGYAMASLIAFTLVALFRRHAVTRLAVASVGTARVTDLLAIALLLAGLVLAVIHAYSIARHYG